MCIRDRDKDILVSTDLGEFKTFDGDLYRNLSEMCIRDRHGGGKNVLRSDYRVVQTPQTFDIGLAKQAFNQEYKEQFTDDASVVESLGCQVAMVEGNRERCV